MRRAPISATLATVLLGCAAGEREVVVTREQLGESWPLEVNSAKVVCARGGELALLKLGTRRYALNPSARDAGYPDAGGVTSSDTEPLRAVCDADVAGGR